MKVKIAESKKQKKWTQGHNPPLSPLSLRGEEGGWAWSVTIRNRNWRGGCYEREKQRAQGKQEGAAVEPQREEKVEEGEEEQVGWKVSIQGSEVV